MLLEAHQIVRERTKDLISRFQKRDVSLQQFTIEADLQGSEKSLQRILTADYDLRFDGSPFQSHPISAVYLARWLAEGLNVKHLDRDTLEHDHFEEIYQRGVKLASALKQFKNDGGEVDSAILTDGNSHYNNIITKKVHKIVQIEKLGTLKHKIVALADGLDNSSDMNYAPEHIRALKLCRFFLSPPKLGLEIYTDIPDDIRTKTEFFMSEIMQQNGVDESMLNREYEYYQKTYHSKNKIIQQNVQKYGQLLEQVFNTVLS
ncbi:hypothetical protein HQ533_03995 [Candidatus Woesearchaeota archaeon]|nr:hypothetical protein [Candidatus Woesearchaeota archaeon]